MFAERSEVISQIANSGKLSSARLELSANMVLTFAQNVTRVHAMTELPNYQHAPAANWPGIRHPGNPTAAEAAARIRRPGVHTPEDLGMTRKQAGKLVSYATKGHVKSHFKARKLGKRHQGRKRRK